MQKNNKQVVVIVLQYDALVQEKKSLYQAAQFFCEKTKVIVADHSENFAILSTVVLIHCQDVTDRRMDTSMTAKRRLA